MSLKEKRLYEKNYHALRVEVFCEWCKESYTIRKAYSYRQRNSKDGYKLRLCTSCRNKNTSKRSKTQVGTNNPFWKGGKTSEIQKFYTSPEWKVLRTKVFVRDNYTCRDCNTRGGQLEANHIKARWKYPKLALDINNIETLCKPCHLKKKWMVYV